MITDKKLNLTKIIIPVVLTIVLGSTQASAQVGTSVYNNIPAPLPPNVPSLGYQATQTAEFGDVIQLEGTTRIAGTVTVTMSNWALHSTYPTMGASGYVHPITLNLYTVASGTNPALGSPIATITQDFLIPWRPEADSTCPNTGYGAGFAWRATDGNCYNGYAFKITFDLSSLAITLPNKLIFGIAYNTNTWGYNPIGQSGPYESLNVGLLAVIPPYIGTDVEPDTVFWNTQTAAWYTDGGANGVGIFRRDTNWSPYSPAVEFTAFTVAATKDACKNGGWQSLSRSDGSSFKNQGDCVSWVNNPNHPINNDVQGSKASRLLEP